MLEESNVEEMDARVEFNRQRQILEQSIINLKNRIKTCTQKKDSYTKIMEENMILIKEIDKLRQELKVRYKTRNNFKTKKSKKNTIEVKYKNTIKK